MLLGCMVNTLLFPWMRAQATVKRTNAMDRTGSTWRRRVPALAVAALCAVVLLSSLPAAALPSVCLLYTSGVGDLLHRDGDARALLSFPRGACRRRPLRCPTPWLGVQFVANQVASHLSSSATREARALVGNSGITAASLQPLVEVR